MRVDAHHHVWDPAARPMPWLAAEGLEPLRRPFGIGDLAPHATAAGVSQTVLVQTVHSLEETREFLRLARAEPLVAGVVGWVDLTAPDVADVLAGLREAPGGTRLAGIRHQVHDEPDPGWLAREDVRRGLRAVAAAGLPYDLLLRPAHLPVALDTARALPELSFVLDHLAKPRIAARELEPWRSGVRALAAQENVVCKLSGMVTEASGDAWAVEDLRPYADEVLDAFGAERVLFGSDWPVCLLAAEYAEVVGACEALLAGRSEAEALAVWGASARRVYALA